MNFLKKLPLLQITSVSRHVFKNLASNLSDIQNVSNSTVAALYRSRSLPPLPEKVPFKDETPRRSLSPNPSVLSKITENPLSLKEFTLIKSCEHFVSVHRATVESRSNSTLQRRSFITMTPRSIVVYKPTIKYRQYNSFKKLLCEKFKFFCKKRSKPKATPNMKMKILPEHGDSTKTRLDVQPISVENQERITPKIEDPEGCGRRKPFCPKPRFKPRRIRKPKIRACTHSSCRKATCTPFQTVKQDSVKICACPSEKPLVTIQELSKQCNPCSRPKFDPNQFSSACTKSDPCCKIDRCPKPNPCDSHPCPKPDPCKTACSYPKPDPCDSDPCPKPNPCKNVCSYPKPNPCKSKPCLKRDPCKKKDPCRPVCPCTRPEPCKKTGPCTDEPLITIKDICAELKIRKPNPCRKPRVTACSFPKPNPCKKADPCLKPDPCKNEDPCQRVNPYPSPSPCKKIDPCADICANSKPCPKPEPCKRPDPCAKADPCPKPDLCKPCSKPAACVIANPCPKPDPCTKDPCNITTFPKPDPCAKSDSCVKAEPCPKPNTCKTSPCAIANPCSKPDPCLQPNPCKTDPHSISKSNPCEKSASCIKVEPCSEPDPCKSDPCKTLEPCNKEVSPIHKKKRKSAGTEILPSTEKKLKCCPKFPFRCPAKPCPKPDPCKKSDPCLKPDPCSKIESQMDSCKKADPCAKPDPCSTCKKTDSCPKPKPCIKADPCSKSNPCKKPEPCPKPEPRITCDSCLKPDPCKRTSTCSKESFAPKSKQPDDDKSLCKMSCVTTKTSPCTKNRVPKAKPSSEDNSRGFCTTGKLLCGEKCSITDKVPPEKESSISYVSQNDFEPCGCPRRKPTATLKTSKRNICDIEKEETSSNCDEIEKQFKKSKRRTVFNTESELPCEDDRCDLCKTPTKCSENSKDNPSDLCKPKPKDCDPCKPKPKDSDPCKPKPKDCDPCKPKPKDSDPCKPKPKDCDPCKPKPKDCDPCKPKPKDSCKPEPKDCDPCKSKTKSKTCDNDNPCEKVETDPCCKKTVCPNKKDNNSHKSKSSGCNTKKKKDPCGSTPKRNFSQLSVPTQQKLLDSVSESVMLKFKPGLYSNFDSSDLNLFKVMPAYPMSGCYLIGGNLAIPTIKKDPGTKVEHKDPEIQIEQTDPLENQVNKTDPTTNIVIEDDSSIKRVTLIAKKKINTDGCVGQPCPPTCNKKQPCTKEEKPQMRQKEVCKIKPPPFNKTVTSKEPKNRNEEKCPPKKPGLVICPDRKPIPSAKEEQKACGPKCKCNKKGLDFEAKKDWCYRFCEQAFISNTTPVKSDTCGSCNRFKVWEDKKELVNKQIKCIAKKCTKKCERKLPPEPPNCCKPLRKRPNPCPQCRVPSRSPFKDYGPKAAEPISSSNTEYSNSLCRKKPCCVQTPCGKKKRNLCKIRRKVIVKYKIDPYVKARRMKSKPKEKKPKKICTIPKQKIDHTLHTEWKAVPLITDKTGKIKKQTLVDQSSMKSDKQLTETEKVPKNFLQGTKGLARSICRVFCPGKGNNDGKGAASCIEDYKSNPCELNYLEQTLLPGENDQFNKRDFPEGWMVLPKMHYSVADLLGKDNSIKELCKNAQYKITYKCNTIPWKKR